MKGLTRAEYEALTYSAGASECPPDGSRTDRYVQEVTELLEQGRMVRVTCACHGTPMTTITPAGREALKLYLELVELGLAT